MSGQESMAREPEPPEAASGHQQPADTDDGSGAEDQPAGNIVCPDEDDNSKGMKRKYETQDVDGDDGSSCPICLTEWSNAGEHRLVSLKCGHLFGLSCIERWLATGCGAQQRRCPQCNKKASRSDVRPLFARRVVVLDTAEQERLRTTLEVERQEKNQLKMKLEHALLNNTLLQRQLAKAGQQLGDCGMCDCGPDHMLNSTPSTLASVPGSLQLLARSTTSISRDGGCRILAFSPSLNLLAVSQPSSNPVFPGFGVRKVDTLDFRPTQFSHLHQKPIRDLSFHRDKPGLLLSVGMDKRARLFDVTSNSVVDTFSTDFPLWSCCWDVNNPFVFVVGGQNGQLLQFDTRHVGGAGEPLEMMVPDRSPLVSIACMSSNGVLACHLGSVQLFQKHGGQIVGEQLPFHGPFFSLRYDHTTQHLLVSSRPSQRFPQTRHSLCQLSPITVVRTFAGGTSQKLLSRPAIVSMGADVMVAAHEESSGCLVVWDVSSGSKVASRLQDAVTDVCPLQASGCSLVTALTEKELHIYELRN